MKFNMLEDVEFGGSDTLPDQIYMIMYDAVGSTFSHAKPYGFFYSKEAAEEYLENNSLGYGEDYIEVLKLIKPW